MDLAPAFIAQCAPGVAPETVRAIVRVESGADPYALHVNGVRRRLRPQGAAEATQLAERYIELGYSVDLGLMQVNSRQLGGLRLTVQEALDPCANLRAGALILSQDYTAATALYGEGQHALHAALSAYNTGRFEAGLRNGYVARYLTAPSASAPATVSPTAADTRVSLKGPEISERLETPLHDGPPNPYTADTRVPLPIDDRRTNDADTAHPRRHAEFR